MESAATLLAPCCLGNACNMGRQDNGAFPLAAACRQCVACNGFLHPICGKIHARSSFLTCLFCYNLYQRTFENKDEALLFIETSRQGPILAVEMVVEESEHDRLVAETKRKMMPDECPKLNRAQSTRDKNRSEIVKLTMWLMGFKNNLGHQGIVTRERQMALVHPLLSCHNVTMGDNAENSRGATAARVCIREWLENTTSLPPFDLQGLQWRDYTTYLSSNLKSNGVPLKGKVYMNKRSILNNLFKQHKFKPSEEFVENLDKYMEGVVRVVAQAAQDGLGSLEMGKREITFEIYEKTMVWFLEERSHEAIFGRAFMALTWNLMCRGVNTCVCLKHLLWRADAFGISFSHVKNDQAGSRNWHPRHIYTNPDHYPVCCVTAVTEYLLCYPQLFIDGNGMLFPGPRQEERFGAILQRVLIKHKEELRACGYEQGDIGVHSIRKGAGTFASSGTTAAPSSVSVNNRGGWTLGGVRDVYMLYERAGDQYVGRILSGMNVLSAKFGASAPDFYYHGPLGVPEASAVVEENQLQLEAKVQAILKGCFGNLGDLICIQKNPSFWNCLDSPPSRCCTLVSWQFTTCDVTNF